MVQNAESYFQMSQVTVNKVKQHVHDNDDLKPRLTFRNSNIDSNL